MAEIRCPMCGKSNPDDLDVCQFCEARLKPLTASLSSDPVPPDGTHPDEESPTPDQPKPSSDLPDWLDFDTDGKFEEVEEASFSDAAPFDDGDDWLSRLENKPESEDASHHQPEAEPGIDKPAATSMDFNSNGLSDWIEDHEGTRSTPPLEKSEDTVEGEFPTWLNADEGSDTSSNLPDWLIDRGSKDENADPLPSEDNDLPNWLAASDDQPTNHSEDGDDEITQPDWTSDHHGKEAGSSFPATDDDKIVPTSGYVEQETEPIQDIQGDTNLPKWLSGEDDGGAEEVESELPTAEADLPDWLSDLAGEETTTPEEVIPSQESTPAFAADDAGELPDWLSGEDDGDAEEVESELPAAEIDPPDWLSDLAGEETTTPEEVIPSQKSTPAFTADDAEELPDLSNGEEDSKVESALPTEDGGLPDWFVDGDTEKDDDLPDWFSDMGSEETSDFQETIDIEEIAVPQEVPPTRVSSVPAFTTDDVEKHPDWLADDDISDSSDEEVAPPPLAAEDDLPDWLSDISNEEPAAPETAIPTQASVPPFIGDDAEELPDWLRSEDEVEAESTLPAAESDLPEWLADLGAGESPVDQEGEEEASISKEAHVDEETTPAFTPDTSKTGVTDWLIDGSADEVKTVLSAAESDLPDWLSGEDEVEAESTPQGAEGDLPDWLSDLGGEETIGDQEDNEETAVTEEAHPNQAPIPAFTPDALKTDATDWLSDGSADDVETDLSPAESDLPDGLSVEDEGEAESAPSAEENDLPDWLSDLDSEETVAPEEGSPLQSAIPAILASEAVDLPDWLSSEAETEAESAPPIEESDLPDWLSDLDGEETASEEGIVETGIPTISASDELPAWLSDVDGDEVERPQETLSKIEPDVQRSSFDESRAVPDWLGDVDGVPVGGVLDDASFGDEEEAELDETDSYDLENGFADDLSEFDQLPEWLSDSSQTDTDQIQEITGPVDDIAQADLPGWLAAMRPVEPVPSEAVEVDRSGPVESSGPLAGLYSVLAAQPEIAQIKKPPVYSNKLQISEAQQTHAALLGDMLQAEGKPQALPLPPLISSHRIFRLILGIMLIAIAFIAVFVGGDMVAMPAPEVIPAGVEQTFQIIAALSQDDTVLVSFDYEPGLVGEMDATSAAVVDNIMDKGAKLALVSTSPTGGALAERFINDVQGKYQYIRGNQYVNLGYIPGGVSGLAAFAQNPNWVTPTTLDGTQAWETELLQNIRSVSDFSLVLLISDNPNTTRAWVEQVNPYLEPVPLVAVVSAQVEPVARTYHGQIDGLVSGLTGGAAYEVMGGSNLAREQWDAFNIILIIAVSAMLIGGTISIGSAIIAQQKGNGGKSA